MNPFATRMSANNWVVPVTALSMVLGFMVMGAKITATNRTSRLEHLNATQGVRLGTGPLDLITRYDQLSDEVKNLRADNDKLQKVLGENGNSSKVLNDSLQSAKAFAGLTDVQGPGVKVTLTDSRKTPPNSIEANNYIIHDTDVLKVTNELFAAGAEAVDVNDHRIVSTSSFRCVGPVIHVDGVPVASPIVIRAIGDPGALDGGLNLPLGVLSEIRQTDPTMAVIEQVKDMRISAYDGSTHFKFAKIPQDKK